VLHISIWGIEVFSGVLSGDGTEFCLPATACPSNWGVWRAADTALDVYDLPVSSVKISKHVIAPYLADLCNLCITDSVFPTKLKLAKVIPVYKSGDKTQPSNYRPIWNPCCLTFQIYL